ncbi:MAG: exo-alpha-sialidase [Sulfuricella sp.]|nr:exo-alpha-sialidase [Sulfuricella sp.]
MAELNHDEPRFQSRFASTKKYTQTHAASLIELKDGRIRAFWFSGSREGASDVVIRTAVFAPERGQWGPERTIATSGSTRQALWRYVKKLGNPVAGRAADGTLWLFYVTVSLGGWAGSSITAMTSIDDGETWSPAQRLVSSPFLNISTLVKGAPFLYTDGTMGIPVYHEFLSKFGELIRMDKTGTVIDKQRLGPGGYSLQPVFLAKSASQALVLMRYSGSERPNRVIGTTTDDEGQHWTPLRKTSLSNPNAALSGVVLSDGRILVALNNVEGGRNALSLVISSDNGATWRTVYQLEDQSATRDQISDANSYFNAVKKIARTSDAPLASADEYAESARRQMCHAQSCGFEFSYPYLIQTKRGDFHLVYTWNRSFIKHVQFTRTWLDQRMEKSADDQSH